MSFRYGREQFFHIDASFFNLLAPRHLQPAIDEAGHAVHVAEHTVEHLRPRVAIVNHVPGEHRAGHRRRQWVAQFVTEQAWQVLVLVTWAEATHANTLLRSGRLPSS